ncbi:hypothetical protein F5883DRAFT_254049 [Diaporthe sp. PMI_573]|nr:hypothetical protein F5883DRAFT_254049 [Diaporthaceae sp. PMI_573]
MSAYSTSSKSGQQKFVGYGFFGNVNFMFVSSLPRIPGRTFVGLSEDHYGLNKFSFKSESYNSILSVLRDVTSLARLGKHYYAVPFGRVHTYTERTELSGELEQKLQITHENANVPHAVSIHGLGGTGKSQLALDYAENHRDKYNPILWIDATNEEDIRSSFKQCAMELGLPEKPVEANTRLSSDPTVRTVL